MPEAIRSVWAIILMSDGALAFGAAWALWSLREPAERGKGVVRWASTLITGRSALEFLLALLLLGHAVESFLWVWAQFYRGGVRMPVEYSWRVLAGSTADAIPCWLFAGYLFGMWRKRRRNGGGK